MMKDIAISMRPKQWYKNFVIFIGIAFSLNLLNFHIWLKVIFAFVIFCMLSGSEYIINDILDIEKDRKHPRKCKRPIASGRLKTSHGLSFAIILIILGVLGASLINTEFLAISMAYFLLILFYSIYLKRFFLVDILTISIGFVIRAVAGCLAISIFISPWLIVCTFLLAMFLALNKRRHELVLLGKDAKAHRKNLEDYSREMLNQMTSIITGALIVSYSLYTFLTNNIYMMITIPFIIYGLFRYLFLVYKRDAGGEAEMLFKDKGMLACMILWAILVVLILYRVPDMIAGFMV